MLDKDIVNSKKHLVLFVLPLWFLLTQGTCATIVPPTTNYTLDDIKASYKKHDFQQTIIISNGYLNAFPKDVDASLFKGLSYQQLHQCDKANEVFKNILKTNPTYKEARIGLINCSFRSNNYSQAIEVTEKGLLIEPDNVELLYLKAKTLTLQHKKSEAVKVLKDVLKKQTDYAPAQTLLKNLQKKEDKKSNEAIKKTEKIAKHQFYPTEATPQKTYIDVNKQKIPNATSEANKTKPSYVAGIFTDSMVVNNPKQVWNLSNLYAYRLTRYGSFGASVNFASRYNLNAAQLELNAIPKINKRLSLDLGYAHANKPELFANNLERAELYAYLPHGVEGSFGGSHRQISHFILNTLTGSMGKYINSYYIYFRPIYFSPGSGPTSTFYKFGIRRYGDPDGQYIGLVFGDGTSPDLTNLLTVDFIKVKNRYFLFEGQQPLNKLFAFQYGLGYEDLRYPNNFLRTLIHVNLGIKMGYI